MPPSPRPSTPPVPETTVREPSLTAAKLAVFSLLVGLVLAWHYPLKLAWALGGVAIAVGVSATYPLSWLVLLPALLPVIGLAPWTGWITFEEFDMLVLAVAAGGFGRMAWMGFKRHQPPRRSRNGGALSVVWRLVAMLFVASVLIAALRGFVDAGGFVFGWYQGYHEPMNSVRLAKSFFLALLLLPLWHHAQRQQPDQAARALSLGLMLGLAGAALATVWERMAFTELLNFSSDYRTTGLFWEMHVGGAALDGFLALTTPFALRELIRARTSARWCLSATVCGLAGYACLTTFSRGVYLAVPVGLLIFYALHTLQHRRLVEGTAPVAAVVLARHQAFPFAGPLLVVGFSVSAGWMFQTSGYRGAMALLGAVALSLPVAGLLRGLKPGQWLAGGIGGLILGAIAAIIAWLVPKGAYIAYLLCFCITAFTYSAHLRKAISAHTAGALAFGGLLATLASVVLVANNWGDANATVPASAAASACMALLLAGGLMRRPLWPDSIRWQSGALGTMAMAVGIVAVFGGGSYMGSRFTTGERDMAGRFAHWKLGADMLQTPADWWFGKGLGRFPSNHFLDGDPQNHPGDYRVRYESNGSGDEKNAFLTLTGGLHINGFGEIFRVTQRISEPGKVPKLTARVRTAKDAILYFEVCEKHLLYGQNCLSKQVQVKSTAGQWLPLQTVLEGDGALRGAWYAPKLLAFSMAVETRGGMVDLDDIALMSQDGRALLSNGAFDADMTGWFFTSDKFHMPWHTKNMFLHVLFDQGLIGLTLWSLLVGGGLVHLTFGKARQHPLAPALAASLVAFAVVGLFDSLLDVPRVATLFYFLTIVGLTLQNRFSVGQGMPLEIEAIGTRTFEKSALRENRSRKPNRIVKTMLAVLLTGALTAGTVAFITFAGERSPMDLSQLTAREWIRHTKQWLGDHETFATVMLRPLDVIQASFERPPPALTLPSLGKGQQPQSLPPQKYSPAGEPIPLSEKADVAPTVKANIQVNSTAEISRAIEMARAGEVIEITPGTYRIDHPITTRSGGTATQPITLRANKPGAVVIEFATVEGFYVTQPYWIFENLTIRGVCPRDDNCEHAFHIVGRARGVVLRNNHLQDFNAHIKVNGENSQWPDYGLVQYNTLTNQRARQTGLPVTPFDLVAASRWQVSDNLVSNFVKAGGNHISYGLFMKGGGSMGRIERNLVICSLNNISQPGNRIGISWGGGESDAAACRDKACVTEHADGLTANNVVLHCNDAGIDANHSRQITIAYNTLINTAGISLRGSSEEMYIHGNLLEGTIGPHDRAGNTLSSNQIGPLQTVFVEPDSLQLGHQAPPALNVPLISPVINDFCLLLRENMTWAGATAPTALPCRPPWH